jgi:glycosyltransferase involved in cell wall biosynthesis
MACELPVITTDVGIARTICRDEPFRDLLLPHGSGHVGGIAAVAAEKVEYLRNNQGLRENLARKGREMIEKKFGIDHWKSRMKEVLDL